MPIDSPESPIDVSEHEPDDARRRIVLSFCATVLIGIVLCAGYLARGGTRAAARVTPASQPTVAPLAVVAITPQPAQPAPPAIKSPPVAKAPVPAKEPALAKPGATYLQMAAVDRGVANVYVEVLRRKGFEAIVSPGPTPEIFRVLVGPVKDAATLARVRADLQAEGFNSFPRKLTSE